MGGGHDHTAQAKIFGGPPGPFKMTLFKIILKVWVVKMLKFPGLTAGYTYINIYTVYLAHFWVVSAPGEFFFGIFPTGRRARKIYL